MIPGPDKVIACPRCRTPARVRTLLSGNVFSVLKWTDGKQVSLMLPRPPAITKCKSCRHYFWLSDAEVIGEIPRWGPETMKVPAEWRSAEEVEELSEEEYLEAIDRGVAGSKEQELYLRISAWWAGNDPLRTYFGEYPSEEPPITPARSIRATSNLERLLDQLGMEDGDERLMKAEAARELGRFGEAVLLLENNFRAEYRNDVAALIRRLARAKDPVVKEITEDVPLKSRSQPTPLLDPGRAR